jgi:AcrR family transcriptional regulator
VDDKELDQHDKGAVAKKRVASTRVKSADRQVQIAKVTLRLIAKYGLSGASLSRIAGEVGISDAALYKHYAGKGDILMAAFDLLAGRIFRWIESSPGTTVIERLRAMGSSHADLFSRDMRGFNIPMFQFNVWIPRDRLRKHVDEVHRNIMSALARMLEEGKAQGCVRDDVDVDVVVSRIYAWIWWEDLSYLRGLDLAGITKGSSDMLEHIIAEISAC